MKRFAASYVLLVLLLLSSTATEHVPLRTKVLKASKNQIPPDLVVDQ